MCLSLENSYCLSLSNYHLLNPLVSRLWTHWREDEPSVWWRRWMATACLRPPSPRGPPRFAPSPAPAQVSTDCLADVRGSQWQRWASGPQQRWSRWVRGMRSTEQIKYKYLSYLQKITYTRNKKYTKTFAVYMFFSILYWTSCIYFNVCVCFSGALITGEYSKTGSKTQLHPRQLHGGGHGWLSWWAGHIFLCQSKAGKTTVLLCCHYYVAMFIYIWIIILIFFPLCSLRIFWCRRSCPHTQTRCLSHRLRRPWKRPSPAARRMRQSWQAAPWIRQSWREVTSCCKLLYWGHSVSHLGCADTNIFKIMINTDPFCWKTVCTVRFAHKVSMSKHKKKRLKIRFS